MSHGPLPAQPHGRNSRWPHGVPEREATGRRRGRAGCADPGRAPPPHQNPFPSRAERPNTHPSTETNKRARLDCYTTEHTDFTKTSSSRVSSRAAQAADRPGVRRNRRPHPREDTQRGHSLALPFTQTPREGRGPGTNQQHAELGIANACVGFVLCHIHPRDYWPLHYKCRGLTKTT